MHILRLPEAKRLTGHRSDASIYGRIRTGEFTKPVNIGMRAVGWPSNEVEAIVAATIAGHTTDQIKALVKQLHADRAKLSPLLAQQPAPAVQTPAPAPQPTKAKHTARRSLLAA